MNALHFAEPQWVHLLWAVLGFAALLTWLERRGHGALDRFVAAGLHAHLVRGPTRAQRGLRIALLALAGACMTVALMRPQWGYHLVATPRVGAEIMICLDVSRSMLAEDVAPNRLERAKAEIRDLLPYLDGDQVGLIAFAGRAAVLSPLTPDFGFLRLALDSADPRSVSLGGTRLEEPIRKAVSGFGDSGDVSRSILLITDGEDHDSFPLEAAKAAAQRGVRILAIGFGDEAGSAIWLTDPATGARTLVHDADGNVVKSRLDGDLLREMALLTEGAYVPAGTGVLDLESIYARHIAPLTRGTLDGTARPVRNDAYQWAVLLAILALLAALASTARSTRPPLPDPRTARPSGAGTAGLALAALLPVLLVIGSGLYPQRAAAQPAAAGSPPPAEPAAAAPGQVPDRVPDRDPDHVTDHVTDQAPGLGQSPPPPLPENPREAYNQGLAALEAGRLNDAQALLEAARERAGSDGETRWRATYNLGWLEARAAEERLESAPPQALERLQRASAWLRSAVELRPENEAARRNLELVLRRALELGDALARRGEDDLQAQLEQAIAAQRAFLAELRATLRATGSESQVYADDALRRTFRALAASELEVLSQIAGANEQAVTELNALSAKPEGERSPEERVRMAQLEGVLRHLHRATERLTQTRAQLRRVQGARAQRRASHGLDGLKRARDQLIDPLRRLDALLSDAEELMGLSAAGLEPAPDSSDQAARSDAAGPAAWLTAEYLAEAQRSVGERTGELHQGLDAAVDGAAPGVRQAAPPGGPAGAEQERRQALRDAAPLIGRAATAFEQAAQDLAGRRRQAALDAQRDGIEALAAARELFLELRGLIEVTHATESAIAARLASPDPGGAEAAREPQAQNIARMQRLGEMISDRLAGLATPAAPADPAAPATEADPAERARLEQAYEHWRQSRRAMGEAERALIAAPPDAVAEASAAVARSLEHLENLRRLFFSVLEHLRETTRRQLELRDETQRIAGARSAAGPVPLTTELGPLVPRQRGLAQRARALAETLSSQAERSAEPPPAAAAGTPSTEGERLGRAGELVGEASTAMDEAAGQLAGAPPAPEPADSAQQTALERLGEAIALLHSPPPPENGGQGQPQPSEGASQPGAEQPESESEETQSPDLARLLQEVRDREAQRREQRAGRESQSYAPVAKDW